MLTILEGAWAPDAVSLFFIQCVVILATARALTYALRLVRQPAVVAEMLGGIIIGPTVMGWVPGWSSQLFPASSLPVINVVANLGLVFFLFLVGLELDPARLRADLGASATISAFGILVPAAASGAFAAVLWNNAAYSTASPGVLFLFLTAVLGISALPVLARILADRRMLTTRLGSLAMSVAAVDDVLAWIIIALILALVASPTPIGILWTLLLILGELVLMFAVLRPLLARFVRRDAGHSEVSPDVFFFVILLLLAVAWLTEIIGMSALIGAFQLGLLIPRTSNLSHHLSEKFEALTITFFMPLYFANSGLKTQFGLIDSGEAWGLTILFVVAATVTKVAGIFAPCWWMRVPARISLVLGVLMACKGLIALIVVNYGINLGLITPKLFAILVLMVLLTTMQTVPLVLLIDPPGRAAASAAEVAAWEAASLQAAEARAAARAARKAQRGADARVIAALPADRKSVV